MLKKTMTYRDYNDETVTEDFYFSLSKAELIEMEMVAGDGGLAPMLAKLIAEDDKAEILKTFKEIILGAVGQRSDDGRRFVKNQQIRDEFEQTPAFSDMLVEFYTKADEAARFVSGIVPSDLKAAVDEAIDTVELPDGSKDEVKEEVPKTWEDFTRKELVEMPDDEYRKLLGGIKVQQMPRPLLAVDMQRKAKANGPQG